MIVIFDVNPIMTVKFDVMIFVESNVIVTVEK